MHSRATRVQDRRGRKEILAEHGKELGGIGGGIRVQGWRMATGDLMTQRFVSLAERRCPAFPAHASM